MIPTDLVLLPPAVRNSLTEPDRLQALARLREARAAARDSMSKARERIQKDTASRPPPPNYQIGDLVMTIKPQGEGKFAKPYSGPYRIENFLHEGRSLNLVHVDTGEMRCSHIDNVKPFAQSEELRPDEAVRPEAAIPTDRQVDRTLTYLDHTLRNAVRAIPLERLRPVLSSALSDEYRRIPELTRGMVQDLEQMRAWQHPMPPPMPPPTIDVHDSSSESENEETEQQEVNVSERTKEKERETERENEMQVDEAPATTHDEQPESAKEQEKEKEIEKEKENEREMEKEKEKEKEREMGKEEEKRKKPKKKVRFLDVLQYEPSLPTQPKPQQYTPSAKGRKRERIDYGSIQNKYSRRRYRR